MKKYVEELLNSEISLGRISRESGVSLSVLKKLSSGRQTVEHTNHGTIEKLYKFYKGSGFDREQKIDNIDNYISYRVEEIEATPEMNTPERKGELKTLKNLIDIFFRPIEKD